MARHRNREWASCLSILAGSFSFGCWTFGLGCSDPEMETLWVHPDKSAVALYRDRDDCLARSDAYGRSPDSPYVASVDAAMGFHECMAALGWKQVERPVAQE